MLSHHHKDRKVDGCKQCELIVRYFLDLYVHIEGQTHTYNPKPAVLTLGCPGSVLLLLTGMELGPFRGECNLLPLVFTDGRLREEGGVWMEVCVFFTKNENEKMSNKNKKGYITMTQMKS